MATTTTLRTYNCASCGVLYGLASDYDAQRREDGKSFYCPNGHSLSYGESEVAKLQRQLDNANEDRRYYIGLATERYDEVKRQSRKAAARKGVITRMKGKAVVGECLFCHERFPNVEHHVVEMHPEQAGVE